MIVDNFLRGFDDLKEYAKTAVFKDEKNDVDGVVYPLICKEIPSKIISQIQDKLKSVLGFEPTINACFMRRSPKGVHCPHKAHSDNSMGDYSLMLYMDDCDHGTSLLNHKATGAKHTRYPPGVVSQLVYDQNNDDAWEVYQMNYGKPNRGFIFDAHLMHRAEPVGGYGEGSNARTVLTCFFS